ncbi:nucleotide exchange factor GrpE [Rhodococcus aerolatus]
MIGRNRDGREAEEPVTITDKRRIDPDTGRARETAPGPGGPDPSATPGEEPAPHDAEPGLAEEAGLLDPEAAGKGEVVDGEVVEDSDAAAGDGQDAGDPVQQELLERTADLQRLSAEYANYRRRVERDRQAVIDAAKASVAGELLGVLDDLDRARSHGDLEGPLKSVADKLAAALTNQGLTAFGAVGDPFDPSVHEAVAHDGAGGEPVVAVVMRQGYRFGERVLRPAMVAVSEDPQDAGPTDDPAGSDTAGNGTAGSGTAGGDTTGGTVPGPGAGPAPAQD